MKTAQQQLDGFIDKFLPEVAAQARACMVKMAVRLPGATIIVYDNYNALAIGYGPGDRTSDAIFSLAVFPRWVTLCFLKNGPRIADPQKMLKGSGNMVRHVRLADPEMLDLPAVKSLMREALQLADPPLIESLPPALIIKSISVKQRPRRPPAK